MNEAKRTRAEETLRAILSRMGVAVDFSTSESEGRVVFDLRGEDAALVIGRQGQTLDALQMLVNRIVTNTERLGAHEAGSPREAEGDDGPPFLLDSDGYRARREESLIGMAKRLADQARRTRRPVAVEGLTAAERRVVHMALSTATDLRTESEGADPHRRLMIVPASASSHAPGGDDGE